MRLLKVNGRAYLTISAAPASIVIELITDHHGTVLRLCCQDSFSRADSLDCQAKSYPEVVLKPSKAVVMAAN